MLVDQFDLKPYSGGTDPAKLIPRMGDSYKHIEGFNDSIDLINCWKVHEGFHKLDEIVESKELGIQANLLKGEILAVLEFNELALDCFKAVLEEDEASLYALYMTLVQLYLLNASHQEIKRHSDKLSRHAPILFDRLDEKLQFIEQTYTEFDLSNDHQDLDLICVFGLLLNEDGTIPTQLENRLKKTLELAERNPNAPILLSGAAVHNKHGEAERMKAYLVDARVEISRLVACNYAKDTVGNVIEFRDYIKEGKYKSIAAVSSIDHIPRAWMTLVSILEKTRYSSQVYRYATEEEPNEDAREKECRLAYHTVLRAAGLFTKGEVEQFEQFNDYQQG